MNASILVVDDERSICIAIERLLSRRGYEVETAQTGEDAISKLGQRAFHLMITDLNLKGFNGMDLLRWVKEHSPETAVIMITAYGSEKIAVEAMKIGAADYLPKPFDNDELELMVDRILEGVVLRRDLRLLQEKVADSYRFENIIGKSAAMQRVFDVIRKVADTDLTILVRGPSGTGKELVANAVHYRSPRRAKPLVKVNCAAFSRELVESELFGHEKGAFTGAATAREGKFEVADGGTLFLDEIGDMSIETQAKILRVLQEKELERVGGNRTFKVDVRVIAATNQDLEAKVKDGSFREDLYYRLNVVPITLPALRERPEDIPLLIEHFLSTVATRLKRESKPLAADAYRALLAHEWKGNIRELEHALEQAIVLASGSEVDLADLPLSLRDGRRTTDAKISDLPRPADDASSLHLIRPAGENPRGGPSDPADDTAPTTFKEAKQRVIESFERQFIVEALDRHHGNISKAAEELGMYRQHLQLKLSEYAIDAEAYRKR